MKTISFLPPPAITGYVSSILVIENPDFKKDFVLPLYANGSPALVFQTVQAVKEDIVIGNLTLYGHSILPGELLFDNYFTLIAYFLQPHALKALFGLKASELTNTFFDLDNVKQAKEIHLQEQLLNEPLLDKRLQLINSFIAGLAALSDSDDRKTLLLTNALKNADSNDLTGIQQKFNTTERSLQRLFETNVGISPKMFKRVCQFHQAFQQLNQYQFAKFTDIVYENGFADQSHFIRVFKEFTGLTPREYLAKSAPYNPRM